ncbi:MAG: DNA polymerase I, partial [Methanolinea sp.]|nr:DNA polymerase I [Methanolinea sp.]
VQMEMLEILRRTRTLSGIAALGTPLRERYREARENLTGAPPGEMAIHRQISTLEYRHACPEASAVQACIAEGIELSPGMEIGYVVADARTWAVELDWKATRIDVGYYGKLLEKAWDEVRFAVDEAEKAAGREMEVTGGKKI